MASQKPLSTISYNSEAFLREKLDDWLDGHIIQCYQYILHKGEDGDKDHIHLRIEPNKRLDPMNLQEALREYVPGNDKPLGCRPFRPSKEEDWFLYVLHDKNYLAFKYGGGDKGEKIPYDISDLRAPFDYDLDIAVSRAKASMKHTAPAIIDQIKNGKSMFDLIASGENIYLMNAIVSALSRTDYKATLQAYNNLQDYVAKMQNAVERAGYMFDLRDDNELELVKK